jgi:hypothetical protein
LYPSCPKKPPEIINYDVSLKGLRFISLREEISEFNVEAFVNDNDMEEGNNENLNEEHFLTNGKQIKDGMSNFKRDTDEEKSIMMLR